MSGFEKSKEITRNTNRLGLVDANQVYDLIKESIDEFGKYNVTEPATVDYVYMKANDLTKRKLPLKYFLIITNKFNSLFDSDVLGIVKSSSHLLPFK